MNDVFFAAHATFATLITITQCFLYDVSDKIENFKTKLEIDFRSEYIPDSTIEIHISIAFLFFPQRADQRVSITGRSILSIFIVTGVLAAILAGAQVIHWLDFLYIASYIKLSITLIKYMPQVRRDILFVYSYKINPFINKIEFCSFC